MSYKQIEVLTYDGYRGGERPRSFSFDGEVIDVVGIVTMRIEEDRDDRLRRRYFSVMSSDGRTYTIMEDERTRAWYLKNDAPAKFGSGGSGD